MQIQNKKTVQKISILASLLVVILLLAGFLFSFPVSAKAEIIAVDFEVSRDTETMRYAITWNSLPSDIVYFVVIVGQYKNMSDAEWDYTHEEIDFEYFQVSKYPTKKILLEKSNSKYYSVFASDMDQPLERVCSLGKVFFNGPLNPLPEIPTKEGHTFTGWYLDEARKIPYAGEPITVDLTLYAGWQINTYTVMFNSAGGSAMAAITTDWNTIVTTQTPTKTGYTFSGWYNGDAKYNGEPIKANTTLTATWEPIILTVTFKVDNEVYKTLQVPYGTTLTEALEAAKLTDYTLNSINFDSGYLGQENLVDFVITDNGIIDVAPLADSQKVIQLIQQFWLLGLLTIIVVAFLLTIPGRKKKKSV